MKLRTAQIIHTIEIDQEEAQLLEAALEVHHPLD